MIQKALNRGEAYHRLRRAVAYVNGGKLSSEDRGRNSRYGMNAPGF